MGGLSGLKVVDFFDSPEVLDCAFTPIPGSGSAPLQVVASLADPVHALEVKDGIQTEFIGVYVGQIGQESLQCIVGGPGSTIHSVYMARGARVSIRALSAETIESGEFCIQFLGKN